MDYQTEEIKNILKPYLDVLVKEFFNENATQYRSFLAKITAKMDHLLLENWENDEFVYSELKETEELLSQLTSFLSIIETTIKILTEKYSEALFFDAFHWEKYKSLSRRNRQLEEDIDFLRNQIEFWERIFEKENQGFSPR